MRRLLRWQVIGLMSLFLGVFWLLFSPSVPLAQQAENLLQQTILDARVDLESLADRVFGGGTRPDTWTANIDLDAPSIIADLWFDTEQLADAVFGAGVRPENWIGATTPNASLVTRNIRHDIEVLADTFIGDGVRPEGWAGGDLITQCDRTLMNTVYLLQSFYGITPTTGESALDYCLSVAAELEDELINATLSDEDVTANTPALTLAVRGDLERLADEELGLGTRPEGWIGNKDINSTTLSSDIFTDIELLADTLVAVGERPAGWLGAISASSLIAYRNLRADLELLADVSLGVGVRPRGWQGESQLVRCDSDLQNLVLVLEQNFEFVGETASASTDINQYCAEVSSVANGLAENPPVEVVDEEEVEDERYTAEAEFAFSYLDAAATQYMGMMPLGTPFRAWYRNFGGSTMMFVSGIDFALFIDRRWTTMSEEVFNTLPTLDGVRPLTFCDANWCNGPGPTPTPTGGGVIYDIIVGVTPPATLSPDLVQQEGKQLVSWNHIRVNYVLQRPEINSAQVTLEICETTAQVACEPVATVFNNNTGLAVPVVSQFNGLNVYELPYGYSTNLLIEGATLYSQDVWLNDPSIE
jgi:hypothetical protein